MLTTKEEIIAWLDKMKIKNYIIHNDLKVTVNGNVDISKEQLTEIPIQFKHVNGDFHCEYNKLISLKGVPQYISGSFYAYENKIESLEYFSETVNGEIVLSDNNLTSLKGFPINHANSIFIANNPLTSLEYLPKIIKGVLNLYHTDIKFDWSFSVEGILKINLTLDGNMGEFDPYCYIDFDSVKREVKDVYFEGPFSEYKRVMQKKELEKNLLNSLEIHENKAQFKL